MFALGLVIGFILGGISALGILVLRLAERPITGKHAAEVLNPKYPKLIPRPKEFMPRVQGRPTNIDVPASTVRPAQFRRRRQTGEDS